MWANIKAFFLTIGITAAFITGVVVLPVLLSIGLSVLIIAIIIAIVFKGIKADMEKEAIRRKENH